MPEWGQLEAESPSHSYNRHTECLINKRGSICRNGGQLVPEWQLLSWGSTWFGKTISQIRSPQNVCLKYRGVNMPERGQLEAEWQLLSWGQLGSKKPSHRYDRHKMFV